MEELRFLYIITGALPPQPLRLLYIESVVEVIDGEKVQKVRIVYNFAGEITN